MLMRDRDDPDELSQAAILQKLVDRFRADAGDAVAALKASRKAHQPKATWSASLDAAALAIFRMIVFKKMLEEVCEAEPSEPRPLPTVVSSRRHCDDMAAQLEALEVPVANPLAGRRAADDAADLGDKG